jgi:hypothetical protein
MTDEGNRVYLGSYESGTHHIVIPRAALDAAGAKLDAARERRTREEARAKAESLNMARNRGKLRKAMRAVFRRVLRDDACS